ncbi:hypothetical protein [Herbiconiux liukaitaii]|uniref:hypothetical protein n=1 Tax=Herbiconiux liukaitaii TaxID=3342799 RepID=UPI0035BA26A6
MTWDTFSNLDDEERTDAERRQQKERDFHRTPTRPPRWITRLPPAPYTVRFTSPLAWTIVPVLALAAFGTWVQHDVRVLIAGLAIALVIAVRTSMGAHRIRKRDDRSMLVRGGLLGREIDICGMRWARWYRSRYSGGMVVLTSRQRFHGGSLFFGTFFPGVSRRRIVIRFASSWRIPATRQKVVDAAMIEAIRLQLRLGGLVVRPTTFDGWIARAPED